MNKTTFEHKYNIGDEVWFCQGISSDRPTVKVGVIKRITFVFGDGSVMEPEVTTKVHYKISYPQTGFSRSGDGNDEYFSNEREVFSGEEECRKFLIGYLEARHKRAIEAL